MGSRFHLRVQLARIGLCGLSHRRLCPPQRGRKRVQFRPDRLRSGVTEASALRTTPRHLSTTDPSQRGSQYVFIPYTEDALKRALRPPHAGSVMLMKLPWRRLSRGYTRRRSCTAEAHGSTAPRSNSPCLEGVGWFNHHRRLTPIGQYSSGRSRKESLCADKPISHSRRT